MLKFYFLNFVLVAFETIIVAYIPTGFFKKRRSVPFFGFSLLVLIIISNAISIVFDSLLIIRVVCFITVCSIWIYLNYRTSFFKSIFAAILIASLQSVIDDAFITLAVHISHNGEAVISEPAAYYFLCYSSKLLSLLISVLICTWSKQRLKHYMGAWSNWLRILFFPVATLSIALILTRIIIENPEHASELLGCIFILLTADLMSIILLNFFEKQQNSIIENTVLRQNLKLESEHIRSIQEAYAQQRKQTHDFNNQLAVLRSMADRGASQRDFVEYLNRVLAIEFPAVTYLNTHRLVVDVILSQKNAVAKSKEIPFNWELDDLSVFPLPDDALVVVLTNLIDNAIEACEKIEDSSKRHILLKMQMKPTSAILYIENTTSQPVHIQGTHIESSKSDPITHGYGLKNVCSTIETHGGMVALLYQEDGVFCFSAKIPIE